MELRVSNGYPATVNTREESKLVAKAAASVVGVNSVEIDPLPSIGPEDFSYMLMALPGCYVWLGNGNREGDSMLHNALYNFNDEVLPVGIS